MSASTIEWTHPPGFDGETWNPTLGCDKVSPGCKFCYAIRSVNRMAGNPNAKIAEANAGLVVFTGAGLNWTGKVNSIESRLSIPLKKKKSTAYFVNSLSDLFHKEITDEFIDKVFAVMALTRQHRYMILTKRPERMLSYIDSRAKSLRYWEAAARSLGFTFKFVGAEGNEHSTCPFPLPNVWLGVSVENQATADARIPSLLRTQAAIRFISYEPAIGSVDFSEWIGYHPVDEINKSRGDSSFRSETRMVGDPGRRISMEDSAAQEEPLGWSGYGESGDATQNRSIGRGRLQTGSHNYESEAGRCVGTSAGMVSLQGDDPGRNGSEPQERNKIRQPSGQSGIGDALRECSSRISDRTKGRTRGEESGFEINGFGSRSDSLSICGGRDNTNNIGESIRCEVSTNIKDRAGGQKTETKRSDGELCSSPVARQSNARLGDGKISMIITGGESGPGARPFDIQWARQTVRRCSAAGVACFVKQFGAFPVEEREVGTAKGGCHIPFKFKDRKGGDMNEWPEDLRVREFPA